jgi:catabolite regulation protein CreA
MEKVPRALKKAQHRIRVRRCADPQWQEVKCYLDSFSKVLCGFAFVANMASYAISSSLILVIHDNIINGTNHIV